MMPAPLNASFCVRHVIRHSRCVVVNDSVCLIPFPDHDFISVHCGGAVGAGAGSGETTGARSAPALAACSGTAEGGFALTAPTTSKTSPVTIVIAARFRVGIANAL